MARPARSQLLLLLLLELAVGAAHPPSRSQGSWRNWRRLLLSEAAGAGLQAQPWRALRAALSGTQRHVCVCTAMMTCKSSDRSRCNVLDWLAQLPIASALLGVSSLALDSC